MKWTKGRQNTGYEKLKLLELGHKSIGGIDAYILRYNIGDSIPVHVDPVQNKRHYRVNLELKKAITGGELFVDKPILRLGRLCIFRSDKSEHAVSEVKAGQRIVLSIGIAL